MLLVDTGWSGALWLSRSCAVRARPWLIEELGWSESDAPSGEYAQGLTRELRAGEWRMFGVPTRAWSGDGIGDGAVGMALLRRWRFVTLDWEGGVVRLSDEEAPLVDARDALRFGVVCWQTLGDPVRPLLFVEGRIDGEPTRILVDSGSSGELWLPMPAGGVRGEGTVAVLGSGEEERIYEGVPVTMHLGGEEIRGVRVLHSERLARLGCAVLGVEFLRRFRAVTVDFQRREIRLHP
jgi:hypothetical protein